MLASNIEMHSNEILFEMEMQKEDKNMHLNVHCAMP